MGEQLRQYGRDDVDYATWYSPWSKSLALSHTRAELERMLARNRGQAGRSTDSHLRAIQATTSMQSQSMRRAHAGNVAAHLGSEAAAIRGALEVHDLFPEHAKGEP